MVAHTTCVPPTSALEFHTVVFPAIFVNVYDVMCGCMQAALSNGSDYVVQYSDWSRQNLPGIFLLFLLSPAAFLRFIDNCIRRKMAHEDGQSAVPRKTLWLPAGTT